ncbi:MAG: chromate resistance protein [Magnetococcales bacterium]|nr:chromate resistance protein [Magnetococcales bacterium]MBF0114275.1 chromate resistance protein [Magnetococcales bacterium]
MQNRLWTVLIHNIPPKPAYLRNKVANRLAAMGAMPLKNSVYVLPDSETARESFLWLAQEVETGGGRAYVATAEFFGSSTDEQIKKAFLEARNEEYLPLLKEAQQLEQEEPEQEEHLQCLRKGLDAIRKRMDEIRRIDFFRAPQGERLREKVSALEHKLAERKGQTQCEKIAAPLSVSAYANRTWVTRQGIFVDRIASAWLIRRFIDPGATFRFVEEWRHFQAEASEISFDIPQGVFTHEGEECTFEVLVRRFGLAVPALHTLARIIHDIDMKVAEPTFPETRGVEAMLAAIAMSDQDEERLLQGSHILESLFHWFASQRAT